MRKHLSLLVIALLLLPLSHQARAAEEVSLGRVDGRPAFTIDVSQAVNYRWYELDQPPRFVIDLYGVNTPPSEPDVELSDTPVARIRAGYQPEQKRQRIVFDLRDDTRPQVSSTASPVPGVQRIQISLPPLRGIAARTPEPSTAAEPGADAAMQSVPAAEPSRDSRSEPVSSWLDDVAFSGTWEQEWAVETDGGDAQKFEALIEPRVDLEIGAARVTGIARIRLDGVGDLGPDQSSPPNYSDANGPLLNSEEAELSLRELYVDFDLGDSAWRIGKQQLVWGEADGLKVLDVVNPQSFREFIMDDFDDSRIPLWMVNAQFPVGLEGSLQLVWVPDTTYHELAEEGTPYFFTSPQRVPALQEGLGYQVNRPDKPSDLSDGDAGARYSVYLGGWDLSFNYLYRYLDTPVFYQALDTGGDVPLVTVSPEYERSHLGGMTLSNSIGDFTLRGEVVYNTDTYFTSTDLGERGVTESAEVSSVIGLDWQLGSFDTFVSGQWFQSHLLDHEQSTVRSETTHTFSLLVQKTFANETWTLDTLGLYSLDDEDSQVQVKLRHLLFSNTEIWLGVEIFSGDDDGLFGQFSERDRALLGFEVGF